MINDALALAKNGWYLFPCSVGSKIPRKGMTDWEARATNNKDEILETWYGNDLNIGLATGPSGLLILDFDAAKSPEERSGIENFRAAYPTRKLPATYSVRTGSGGWHLYYKAPEGVELRNSAGRLAERVDTRGKGGYVLAPGSVVDGNHYVVTSDAPVADLPEWIVKELADKPATRTSITPKGNSTAYALAALRRECADLADMMEGGRNHQANKAAWNVSRFVAKGELDQTEAEASLLIAAMECGLPPREAEAAVNSGMSRGIKKYEADLDS